jgi:hypothetical protein
MSKRTRRVKLDDPDDEGADGGSKREIPVGVNGNSLLRAGAGRPPGSTDLIPRSIKALIKEAMDRHGEDGQGKEGALGYLTMLARDHKHLFVSLMRRTLPLQLRAEVEPGSLLQKLMQTASAERSTKLNGNGGNVIDVTPLRPSRTRYAVEKDDGEYAVEDLDDDG